MADNDINNPLGVVDRRAGRGVIGSNVLGAIVDLTSISAMRARLTAINPTSFTSARLNTMTENDMLYAIRVHTTDSAGI